MAASFDLERVSLGGPVFDQAKLSWLNGRYIREDLSVEQLGQRLLDWAGEGDSLHAILRLVHERVDKLSDVLPRVAHFFSGPPALTEASFQHKKISLDECKKTLVFAGMRLDDLLDWSPELLRTELERLSGELSTPLRDLLFPLFVAVSGQAVSTPLFDTLSILGADLARTRVRAAIEALGGVSKKQAKAFELEYRVLGERPEGDPETESESP
jgi:glutamyl-tRNA synthetase